MCACSVALDSRRWPLAWPLARMALVMAPIVLACRAGWVGNTPLMFQRRCQGGSVVPEAIASRLRSMLCPQPLSQLTVAHGGN